MFEYLQSHSVQVTECCVAPQLRVQGAEAAAALGEDAAARYELQAAGPSELRFGSWLWTQRGGHNVVVCAMTVGTLS